MLKEGIITCYLFVFKIIFSLFNLLPLQNKTVFLSSFGNNAFFVAKELSHSSSHPLVFLNKKSCKMNFSKIPSNNKKIYQFETTNILDTVWSIYHLATSKYIFIDNYVGALSKIRFRDPVKCIQLWHAAGAIKRFGWSDPTTSDRSKQAKTRFQEVYNQFHYIPVGSQEMARIFRDSFHVEHHRFLFTGVPKTDFYYNENAKTKSLKRVQNTYPIMKGKKVVLYAPTFRKDQLDLMNLQLDINEYINRVDEDHVLLIRLHPAVKNVTQILSHPRVIVVNDYPYVNDLMVASDILITDYSSIPFEFSLLRRKMIFFTYDLASYEKDQGLWDETSVFFPGPMVKTTSEVIDQILDPNIDFNKIDQFIAHWNTFSTGTSATSLISLIYDDNDL